MERKNLWKLGEDKAKFLSKRGTRKRKKAQVKKKVPRKSRKLSDDKKSQSLQKPATRKPKRKLSSKKISAQKKKPKKKEKEEELPERFLYPDELEFDQYIYKKKKYRINPIKRDGNCLFRAVADQVYSDPSLHAKVRNFCANFMQEDEKYFSEFKTDEEKKIDYSTYISDLREDGVWGGNYEIFALAQSYKRSIEVYEQSEKPRIIEFSNNQGNNGPPMRLFYRNNHYASIRSDGVGQLFNFDGLEPGEIKQQMINLNDLSIIKKSSEFQKRILSQKNLADFDSDTRQAIEKSIAIDESEKAYFRFYASKLISQKSNQE